MQETHELVEMTVEDLDGFGVEDLEKLLEEATEEIEPRVAPSMVSARSWLP